MKLTKATITAIASGLAAALVALAAALASGQGINAAEWVTIVLSFLSGSGLSTAVTARSELRATQRDLLSLRTTQTSPTSYASTADLEALSGRLGEIETAISASTAEANRKDTEVPSVDPKIFGEYLRSEFGHPEVKDDGGEPL